MNKNKKPLLLTLSTIIFYGGALSGFTINASAADWNLTPSVTLTETYTDNVDLDSSEKQGDFVTQVSPQIDISRIGARLETSIIYSANYFYYPDGNDVHEVRHNLQSSLSSELVSDLLFIDASAGINQRFLDRQQAISSEQTSRTDNRRTVQTYNVSPYLAHQFGSWATAQLKYTFRHVRMSADPEQTTNFTVFGNSLSHEGSFTINSGNRFNKLGWTLSAIYSNEGREVSNDLETTTARADFSYQLTDVLSLLGSAGYQNRDASGSFVNFKGFVWDAGFRLTPGPRTSLSFRYGNQYNGDTFSLNALYKITSKNTITLSYSDFIQTFQSLAFEDNSNINLDSSLGSDFISGDLTRRKRWSLSLSGIRGRTSYSASAFYSEYKGDNLSLNEERYGGVVSLNRALNSKLNISGVFSYNLSKFLSDGINDKFWSASANINYKISKSLIGTISYSHSDRDQARQGILNGGSNYISISIRAAI